MQVIGIEVLDVRKRMELSGVDVLRQAARVLGEPEIAAVERYIQTHAPPWNQDWPTKR
jgi:hypothetical protein